MIFKLDHKTKKNLIGSIST